MNCVSCESSFLVNGEPKSIDWAGTVEDEAMIEHADMAVTITNGGYIKRTGLDEYREQARGGKGLQGMTTKDDDFVTSMFVVDTHTPLLFFTTDGMVYKLKTWRFAAEAGGILKANPSLIYCRFLPMCLSRR